MASTRTIWLIHNDSSGSNDEEALAELDRACTEYGLCIARRTSFPAENLPSQADIDAAGADTVAVFAGDGTINAALDHLAGWGGQVLILPGGTMNMLYHRLFGELEVAEVLAELGAGRVVTRRPGMITSPLGNAYVDLLVGPGTSWSDVREAMRDADVASMAADTRTAFAETLSGQPVYCREPALGRPEGYPLLQLEPHDDHIAVKAYHAENVLEFLDQLFALVRHDFRSGPHDLLGQCERLVLAGVGRAGFGVLLDGEQAEADDSCEFALAPCQVDLLATVADD